MSLLLLILQPHQDGPAYYPVVAILSLGSPVVMDFVPHSRLGVSKDLLKSTVGDESSVGDCVVDEGEWRDNHHPSSVLLMPRSLLIFKDAAYSGNFISQSQILPSYSMTTNVLFAPDYLHGIKDDNEHPYEQVSNRMLQLRNQLI